MPESWVPPKEIRELRELVKGLPGQDADPGEEPGSRGAGQAGYHAHQASLHQEGDGGSEGLGIKAVSQLLPVTEILDRQIAKISVS